MPDSPSPSTTSFELVTPQQVLLASEARMVVMPGSLGRFGVLPRHAPMLAMLQFGVVEIYAKATDSPSQRVMIDDGIADVTGEACLVLASRAEVLDKSRTSEIKQKRDSAARRGNTPDVKFLDRVLAAL